MYDVVRTISLVESWVVVVAILSVGILVSALADLIWRWYYTRRK